MDTALPECARTGLRSLARCHPYPFPQPLKVFLSINLYPLNLTFKFSIKLKSFHHFARTKNPNPMHLKSHVIYKLTCPACDAEYMGKADRCLSVRLDEHSSDHNSATFQHLHSAEAFKFLFSLNNLPGWFKPM